MKKPRFPRRLRGSVTQNAASAAPVRLRPRPQGGLGLMMRLAAMLGSVAILIGLVAWLWHIGWPQRQTEHIRDAALRLTQKAAFAVKDVTVEGRHLTSKESLATALGINAGAPILTFDPEAAQARIVRLPWVAAAIVERRLPDTLRVLLTERAPLAIWQHDGHMTVIDASGKELPEAKPEQFAHLPLVVGAGAAAEAPKLLTILADYPTVADKMTAAIRVGERRWDLRLPPKITVRLPDTNLDEALKRLTHLMTEEKILERNVVAIDLRMADRLVIEPAAVPATRPGGDMRL